MRLRYAPNLTIDEGELAFTFIQAGGPGGQNVNKLATAAQLRFDVAHSPSLPEHVKARLRPLANAEGVVVITARRFRSQKQNREEAIARLLALLGDAAHRQAPRRATRPSLSQKRQRLDAKSKRAGVKRLRQAPGKDVLS